MLIVAPSGRTKLATALRPSISSTHCIETGSVPIDDVLENGRPRYTEAQKEEVKQSIAKMLDLIHRKDYFTIAKDVRKSRLRPYIMSFLRFASEEDRELCATIRKQNILVMDDVTTSGSTLNEILRTLRILNEDNEITVFSLIGRKDLMAETM